MIGDHLDYECIDHKQQRILNEILYASGDSLSAYINEKDKTNLPFIANQILKGMFLSEDPKIQQLYNEAFKWISESDNKEAIENVTNSFVKLGLQYKKYNYHKISLFNFLFISYLKIGKKI